MNIDITDAAINQLLIKKRDQGVEYIRLGVTGGGCAGYEYVFKDAIVPTKEDQSSTTVNLVSSLIRSVSHI